MIHNKNNSISRYILIYTAIFAVTAVGVFFLLLINDKTLLRDCIENNPDSFFQRYMFVFEFKRFVANLFAGGGINTWDWSLGLGDDALAFNAANLFNPLSYISLLLPAKYIDLWYSIMTVIKMYLSGVTYMFLARKLGHTGNQMLLGAVVYVFCPWIVLSALTQGTFLTATVMLPLVILGIEKVYKGESPVFFALITGYTILLSFNYAYVIGIIAVLYALVRFFATRKEERAQAGNPLGKVFGYGSIGVMISGVVLLITVMRYTGSSLESGDSKTALLLSTTQLLRLPAKLFDWVSVFGIYSIVGMSSICVIMIPFIIIGITKKRPNAIMACILAAFVIFPVISSALNFFVYPSGRWMFCLAMFFALASVECLKEYDFREKWAKVVLIVFVLLCGGYLVWARSFLTYPEKLMVLVNYGAAIIFVLCLIVKRSALSKGIIMAVVLVSFMASYNLGADRLYDGTQAFLDNGEAEKLLKTSPQRAGQKIEDNDFYRIDQVEELSGVWTPHCKVNEAMYHGNRSNYGFYSGIDTDWLNYNKMLGNNQGYYLRVAPNSNDNRFGINLLQGIKYFVYEEERAEDFAGYGFEPYKTIDGVKVLKNKYSIGLGCIFESAMKESEWLKLNYADRELAMLQCLVVPEGEKIEEGIKELKAEDVRGTAKVVKYTKTEEKGHINLKPSPVKDANYIMTVKNVASGEEGNIRVTAQNREIKKTDINPRESTRGLGGITDMTFNLGKSEFNDTIDIDVSVGANTARTDSYTYDDIEIYAVEDREYERLAKELVKNKLSMDTFNNDYIKVKANSQKDGLVYMSVPNDKGWTVYVDGKEAPAIRNADMAFIGVYVPEGKHTIEIEYHTKGFWVGLGISVLGLAILWFVSKRRARKKTILVVANRIE